jgi:hypothetical protein
MNEKVKLFLIIFVVYFFIRIISKYKVIEGVDGSNSETPDPSPVPSPVPSPDPSPVPSPVPSPDPPPDPSPVPSSDPPPDPSPVPSPDPVREPCTIEDVINNNKGDCNENGTVSGVKIDGDISRCRCYCNDGFRNRNQADNTNASCIQSEKIQGYHCYAECKNEGNIYEDIFRDETSDKKEACNWIENMLGNCGRRCTMEGGGTTISDNLIRKKYDENIIKLTERGYCNFSTDKMIDSVIGDNFIRLLHFCQLFNVSKFKYIALVKLSDDEINNLFTNTTENFNSLKQELVTNMNFSCNDMDLNECIKKAEEEILIVYDDWRVFYKTKLYTKKFTIYNLLEDFTRLTMIDSLLNGSRSKYVEEAEETEILTKLINTIQILVGLNADDGNIKVSDFDEIYYNAMDKIDEQIDKSDLDKNNRNLYISKFFFGTENPERGIEELIQKFFCIKYSDKYDYENSRFKYISNEMCITQNKNKCFGNINFDDNVICKRLKYDNKMNSNTPKDECCDIAWYENAWYWLVDLF